MLNREQETEIIVRGMRDRQSGETDEELAGRIIDDFARTNTEDASEDDGTPRPGVNRHIRDCIREPQHRGECKVVARSAWGLEALEPEVRAAIEALPFGAVQSLPGGRDVQSERIAALEGALRHIIAEAVDAPISETYKHYPEGYGKGWNDFQQHTVAVIQNALTPAEVTDILSRHASDAGLRVEAESVGGLDPYAEAVAALPEGYDERAISVWWDNRKPIGWRAMAVDRFSVTRPMPLTVTGYETRNEALHALALALGSDK